MSVKRTWATRPYFAVIPNSRSIGALVHVDGWGPAHFLLERIDGNMAIIYSRKRRKNRYAVPINRLKYTRRYEHLNPKSKIGAHHAD